VAIQFTRLLHRRDDPWFCAFDLLWLDVEELRVVSSSRASV